MCDDSGEKGVASASSFSLCALGFAQSEYLLTEKEITSSGMFLLKVNDPSHAHGLLNDKMTLVLLKEVVRLAEEKFGGETQIAEEKRVRLEKSLVNWQARCDQAKLKSVKLPARPKTTPKVCF